MLNEAPNSNDAMQVVNNIHLATIYGYTTILNGGYVAIIVVNNIHLATIYGYTAILNGGYVAIMQKSGLTRDKR